MFPLRGQPFSKGCSMDHQLACPHCRQTLAVSEALLGRDVKCPACQGTFPAGFASAAVVPLVAAPPPSSAPAATYRQSHPTPGEPVHVGGVGAQSRRRLIVAAGLIVAGVG